MNTNPLTKLNGAVTSIIALTATLGCSSRGHSEDESLAASTAQGETCSPIKNLQLQELTKSCGTNQAQQFFKVVNGTASAVKLSDIKIKFWLNDTSASNGVAAFLNTPGCVTNAGNPRCVHSVPASNATIKAAQFYPCGPDANHQANWEITIESTDTYAIPVGGTWSNIQTALRLANNGRFTPGTSTWYSRCLTGSAYTNDSHFAIYYQNNLVYGTGINAPDCRAPKGTQVLTGHVPAAVATAPLMGPVPAEQIVTLSIGLPSRDPPGLKTFVQQISDPSDPQYRQYLDSDTFITKFGAQPGAFDQLVPWASVNGLTITNKFDSNMLLGVQGTAKALNQALFVNLNLYKRPDGTQFYAPDREPSLNLLPSVLHITGLENFYVAKPATLPPNGSGKQGTYLAGDLRMAFAKDTDLDGTNQRLGLLYDSLDLEPKSPTFLQRFGYPTGTLKTDIQAYLNLSSYGTLSTKITNCNVSTGDGVCSANPFPNTVGADSKPYGELTLDVEMALALAPKLTEIVIFEGDLVPSLKTLATRKPQINQFSTSYGFHGADSNVELTLLQLAAQGQSVFASSGDTGPYVSTTDSKSHDYAVTLAGGTELQLDSNKQYGSETVWWEPTVDVNKPGTGAGYIKSSPLPGYQFGMNIPDGSLNYRNFPDVSMPAYKILTVQNSASYDSGGTSASAPLWAAFTALMNQRESAHGELPLGFLNPMLYAVGRSEKYSEYFHDITTGSTGASTIYSASPGYDMASGWGSPTTKWLTDGPIPLVISPKDMAVGKSHSCGLRSGRVLACWGANDHGQLGIGSYMKPLVPSNTVISWPTSAIVRQIVAGAAHSCALLEDSGNSADPSSVWCWGANNHGQLGNAATSTADVLAPTRVKISDTEYLRDIQDIAAGGNHTCAVKSGSPDNTTWCWGENDSWQLGDGTKDDATVAVKVAFGTGQSAIHVAVGEKHSCAASDKTFYCWGAHDLKQLGSLEVNDTDTYSSKPVAVQMLSRLITGRITGINGVVAGDNHTCALLDFEGWTNPGVYSAVYCWGSNSNGQLGQNPLGLPYSNLPIEATVCGPSASVSAGSNHTCTVFYPTQSCGDTWYARLSVVCWGDDTMSQLGDNGTSDKVFDYVVAQGLSNMSIVAAGGSTTCAASSSGHYCWGLNDKGQVGDGTTTNAPIPKLINLL